MLIFRVLKTFESLLQLSRLFPHARLTEFCESFSSDSNLTDKLKSYYLLTETIDWLQSSTNSSNDIPYDFFTKIREKAFYQYGTDVTPSDFTHSSPEADGQLSDWLILEADNWHRLDNQKYETRVSVWGYNKHNQLGTVTQLDTVKKPFESMSLNSLNPSTIHLGEHSIYLLSDHCIWSCGEMANGRLGHPVPDGATVLGKLTKIENIPLISQIAVHPTGRHVLAVTISGALMSWGDGEYGQTGHGLKESIEKPRLVQTTQGIEFTKIAAGKSHSARVSAR